MPLLELASDASWIFDAHRALLFISFTMVPPTSSSTMNQVVLCSPLWINSMQPRLVTNQSFSLSNRNLLPLPFFSFMRSTIWWIWYSNSQFWTTKIPNHCFSSPPLCCTSWAHKADKIGNNHIFTMEDKDILLFIRCQKWSGLFCSRDTSNDHSWLASIMYWECLR